MKKIQHNELKQWWDESGRPLWRLDQPTLDRIKDPAQAPKYVDQHWNRTPYRLLRVAMTNVTLDWSLAHPVPGMSHIIELDFIRKPEGIIVGWITTYEGKTVEESTILISGEETVQRQNSSGENEFRVMAANFLYLLNMGYLGETKVVPTWPSNPSLARQIRKSGKLMESHSVIRLLPPRIVDEPQGEPTKTGIQIQAHLVRGHYHRYWVKDPKDQQILETKRVQDHLRYCIAKWLDVFQRGKGEPKQPLHSVQL